MKVFLGEQQTEILPGLLDLSELDTLHDFGKINNLLVRIQFVSVPRRTTEESISLSC